MGENSKTVRALAAEVAAGVKGKTLADFRTLAEANGFRMIGGGWITRAGGINVQGWRKLAAAVAAGHLVMLTVQESAEREVRCDACSTLRRITDLARTRVVGGAGSSETESYCKNGCSRVLDVEHARALASAIEEQRAATSAAEEAAHADALRLQIIATDYGFGPGYLSTLTAQSADQLLRRYVPLPPRADPATEDDSNELLDRIVRRAQYTALKAMIDVVDAATEWPAKMFTATTIKRMVNDVARELGTAEPHHE